MSAETDSPTAPPPGANRVDRQQQQQRQRASETLPERRPRIGLALGGGGARGLAHILMLEAFDELGLKPDIMAGTSIGAIFGAGYASGLSAAQIRAHAEELLSRRSDILRQVFQARNQPLTRMLSIFQLRSALLNPEALLELVMPTRTASSFEALDIPLRIIAADFYTQDEIVFSEGPLKPAVAASMAIPGLFAPVTNEDRFLGPMALMDGGLVNPLPFDVIAPDVDITIAVNVSGAGRLPDDRSPPSTLEAFIASAQIMQNTITFEKLKSKTPDVLINVDVGRFHVLQFHKLSAVLESAAPAKVELKRKLDRVLSAETLPSVDTPPKEERNPSVFEGPPRGVTRQDRPRLAQRILGRTPKD